MFYQTPYAQLTKHTSDLLRRPRATKSSYMCAWRAEREDLFLHGSCTLLWNIPSANTRAEIIGSRQAVRACGRHARAGFLRTFADALASAALLEMSLFTPSASLAVTSDSPSFAVCAWAGAGDSAASATASTGSTSSDLCPSPGRFTSSLPDWAGVSAIESILIALTSPMCTRNQKYLDPENRQKGSSRKELARAEGHGWRRSGRTCRKKRMATKRKREREQTRSCIVHSCRPSHVWGGNCDTCSRRRDSVWLHVWP